MEEFQQQRWRRLHGADSGCGNGGRGGGAAAAFEKIPEEILVQILSRLDLESLCSSAAVSRSLRASASLALSSILVLDLSGFAPSLETLQLLLSSNRFVQSLTMDCSRLDDSAIDVFVKENLQELVLQKCSIFSAYVFIAIGKKCCMLRVLALELRCLGFARRTCEEDISEMLKGCCYLESLSVKLQSELLLDNLEISEIGLPETVSDVLLQPTSESQTRLFLENSRVNVASNLATYYLYAGRPVLRSTSFRLCSLSLVLDHISDALLQVISRNLHHLTELCLEDRLKSEPFSSIDLTNTGLEALTHCGDLARLSITRSKHFFPATFKLVNDMGMFSLAGAFHKLESLRLGGFSRVTDAGYAYIIESCKELKRFEVVNGAFLSDLAFHDLANTSCSLVDVKLISCNLLTSEALESLSTCKTLEVLDLSGCKSISDSGINSMSKLPNLCVLDLGGADITGSGLVVLGSMFSRLGPCLCEVVRELMIKVLSHY